MIFTHANIQQAHVKLQSVSIGDN